jgi:hypothetical protein
MSQTRIVLPVKYKPKAQEILDQTGIESLSQLFTIFIVNYGDKLVTNIKGEQP